jgi:thioredoxin 1
MSGDRIKKFTEDSFQSEIKKGVVLVDFYADWCGPCRMMTPILEKVADESAGNVVIAKLDIDSAQSVAGNFQVTSVPTLILFKNGKVVGRLVGLRGAEEVKEFISTAATV